ncbi:MAG: hypothetical protein IJV00_02710 [Clostridia bacterium]|nr:hypothetical protein [Clostridia bacterium]
MDNVVFKNQSGADTDDLAELAELAIVALGSGGSSEKKAEFEQACVEKGVKASIKTRTEITFTDAGW